MNITISGQHDAPDLPSGTLVVLALSPVESPQGNPDLQRPGHLWLPMDDIDAPDEGGFLPTSFHLKKLHDFLWDGLYTTATDLHFACWMGVSRSTALAAFTLATFYPYLTDRELADEVFLLRPQAVPNRQILRLIDAGTGRNLLHQFSSLEAYD